MIETEHKISLNKQLKILNISKVGYYYKKIKPFNSSEDIELLNTIDLIYTDFPYYGAIRMSKALKRKKLTVGKKKTRSIMKFMGLQALYPKVKTTKANKEHQKYPYLLKDYKNDNNQVVVNAPNEVWSTDITYIRLDKGFVYLAAIIDWHTKKILSWNLSNTIDTHLTTGVLNKALSNYPKPKIFNTDQGSQYTAKDHIDILVKNNISISMDSKGRSIDNIVIERFWRSLKYEDVYPNSYNDILEAKKGIGRYIENYNNKRLHSSIDYNTPDEIYYKGVNSINISEDKGLLMVG